jgi:hypothetical protein
VLTVGSTRHVTAERWSRKDRSQAARRTATHTIHPLGLASLFPAERAEPERLPNASSGPVRVLLLDQSSVRGDGRTTVSRVSHGAERPRLSPASGQDARGSLHSRWGRRTVEAGRNRRRRATSDSPDAGRGKAPDEVQHDHSVGVTAGATSGWTASTRACPFGICVGSTTIPGSGPLRGTILG